MQWVEETIRSMSLEEKIGQLFVNMVANEEERRPENIKKVLDTYHPGAIRYHNASKEELWEMAKNLQDASRIPLLLSLIHICGSSVLGDSKAFGPDCLGRRDR